MNTHRKNELCTFCFTHLDAATPTRKEKAVPKEGDISLCINCGGIHMFSNDLSLRKMTDEEFNGLDSETKEHLVTVQRAISALKKN